MIVNMYSLLKARKELVDKIKKLERDIEMIDKMLKEGKSI